MKKEEYIERLDAVDDEIFELVVNIARMNGHNIDNDDFDNESVMEIRNHILEHLKDRGLLKSRSDEEGHHGVS